MTAATPTKTRATLASSTAKTAPLTPTTSLVLVATHAAFPMAAPRGNPRRVRAKRRMCHSRMDLLEINHQNRQRRNQKVSFINSFISFGGKVKKKDNGNK
jgi:hypothetical protein